jgi:hypothetical protein
VQVVPHGDVYEEHGEGPCASGSGFIVH